MIKARLLLLCSSLLCSTTAAQDVEPTKAHANGVDLHYVERGRCEPLILLHGGQSDYRSWGPQMEELSRRYRVVSVPEGPCVLPGGEAELALRVQDAGDLRADVLQVEPAHGIHRSRERLLGHAVQLSQLSAQYRPHVGVPPGRARRSARTP